MKRKWWAGCTLSPLSPWAPTNFPPLWDANANIWKMQKNGKKFKTFKPSCKYVRCKCKGMERSLNSRNFQSQHQIFGRTQNSVLNGNEFVFKKANKFYVIWMIRLKWVTRLQIVIFKTNEFRQLQLKVKKSTPCITYKKIINPKLYKLFLLGTEKLRRKRRSIFGEEKVVCREEEEEWRRRKMYEEGKIDADRWTNRNRRLHKRGPSGPKMVFWMCTIYENTMNSWLNRNQWSIVFVTLAPLILCHLLTLLSDRSQSLSKHHHRLQHHHSLLLLSS